MTSLDTLDSLKQQVKEDLRGYFPNVSKNDVDAGVDQAFAKIAADQDLPSRVTPILNRLLREYGDKVDLSATTVEHVADFVEDSAVNAFFESAVSKEDPKLKPLYEKVLTRYGRARPERIETTLREFLFSEDAPGTDYLLENFPSGVLKANVTTARLRGELEDVKAKSEGRLAEKQESIKDVEATEEEVETIEDVEVTEEELEATEEEPETLEEELESAEEDIEATEEELEEEEEFQDAPEDDEALQMLLATFPNHEELTREQYALATENSADPQLTQEELVTVLTKTKKKPQTDVSNLNEVGQFVQRVFAQAYAARILTDGDLALTLQKYIGSSGKAKASVGRTKIGGVTVKTTFSGVVTDLGQAYGFPGLNPTDVLVPLRARINNLAKGEGELFLEYIRENTQDTGDDFSVDELNQLLLNAELYAQGEIGLREVGKLDVDLLPLVTELEKHFRPFRFGLGYGGVARDRIEAVLKEELAGKNADLVDLLASIQSDDARLRAQNRLGTDETKLRAYLRSKIAGEDPFPPAAPVPPPGQAEEPSDEPPPAAPAAPVTPPGQAEEPSDEPPPAAPPAPSVGQTQIEVTPPPSPRGEILTGDPAPGDDPRFLFSLDDPAYLERVNYGLFTSGQGSETVPDVSPLFAEVTPLDDTHYLYLAGEAAEASTLTGQLRVLNIDPTKFAFFVIQDMLLYNSTAEVAIEKVIARLVNNPIPNPTAANAAMNSRIHEEYGHLVVGDWSLEKVKEQLRLLEPSADPNLGTARPLNSLKNVSGVIRLVGPYESVPNPSYTFWNRVQDEAVKNWYRSRTTLISQPIQPRAGPTGRVSLTNQLSFREQLTRVSGTNTWPVSIFRLRENYWKSIFFRASYDWLSEVELNQVGPVEGEKGYHCVVAFWTEQVQHLDLSTLPVTEGELQYYGYLLLNQIDSPQSPLVQDLAAVLRQYKDLIATDYNDLIFQRWINDFQVFVPARAQDAKDKFDQLVGLSVKRETPLTVAQIELIDNYANQFYLRKDVFVDDLRGYAQQYLQGCLDLATLAEPDTDLSRAESILERLDLEKGIHDYQEKKRQIEARQASAARFLHVWTTTPAGWINFKQPVSQMLAEAREAGYRASEESPTVDVPLVRAVKAHDPPVVLRVKLEGSAVPIGDVKYTLYRGGEITGQTVFSRTHSAEFVLAKPHGPEQTGDYHVVAEYKDVKLRSTFTAHVYALSLCVRTGEYFCEKCDDDHVEYVYSFRPQLFEDYPVTRTLPSNPSPAIGNLHSPSDYFFAQHEPPVTTTTTKRRSFFFANEDVSTRFVGPRSTRQYSPRMLDASNMQAALTQIVRRNYSLPVLEDDTVGLNELENVFEQYRKTGGSADDRDLSKHVKDFNEKLKLLITVD